ncbi:unnamed protein product [Symbiodinium sp. KB8]|nr:unnamed protein product [Symbiodinium sp. KB8]
MNMMLSDTEIFMERCSLATMGRARKEPDQSKIDVNEVFQQLQAKGLLADAGADAVVSKRKKTKQPPSEPDSKPPAKRSKSEPSQPSRPAKAPKPAEDEEDEPEPAPTTKAPKNPKPKAKQPKAKARKDPEEEEAPTEPVEPKAAKKPKAKSQPKAKAKGKAAAPAPSETTVADSDPAPKKKSRKAASGDDNTHDIKAAAAKAKENDEPLYDPDLEEYVTWGNFENIWDKVQKDRPWITKDELITTMAEGLGSPPPEFAPCADEAHPGPVLEDPSLDGEEEQEETQREEEQHEEEQHEEEEHEEEEQEEEEQDEDNCEDEAVKLQARKAEADAQAYVNRAPSAVDVDSVSDLWDGMSASASQLAITEASPEVLRAAVGGLLQRVHDLQTRVVGTATPTAPPAPAKKKAQTPPEKESAASVGKGTDPAPKTKAGAENDDGESLSEDDQQEEEEEEEEGEESNEEEEEEQDDEKEEHDDKPSVVTPSPMAPRDGPTPPKDENRLCLPAKVNSATHRKEWMLCTRRMEVLSRANFPEIHKLWDGSLAAVRWVELTVAEMVEKKFSVEKIESIVRKGGTRDPDAPNCIQSIKYWCREGSRLTNTDSVSQRAQAHVNVKASSEMLGSLLGGPAASDVSAASRDSANAHPDAGAAIALMNDLMGSHANAGNTGGPKAKAKGKAKAAAKQQMPRTLEELFEDSRKELKKELKLSDAIHDLPKGNALRESLQKFIDQLHKHPADDEIAAYAEEVAELAPGMERAQAKAVANEHKKQR